MDDATKWAVTFLGILSVALGIRFLRSVILNQDDPDDEQDYPRIKYHDSDFIDKPPPSATG